MGLFERFTGFNSPPLIPRWISVQHLLDGLRIQLRIEDDELDFDKIGVKVDINNDLGTIVLTIPKHIASGKSIPVGFTSAESKV